MPVKCTIPYSFGTFFITFTCFRWLPLIEKVQGYDIICTWFDYLKSQGHYINGYVIMPNHLHLLISFAKTSGSINTIIGNGKRFMAYEIIKRLRRMEDTDILDQLSANVEESRRANNKRHNVWELSFDWKECRSLSFINQKLDYMHANPCVGKWDLSDSPFEYAHSSTKFYLTGEQGIYPVTNILDMEDTDLTAKWNGG